MPSRSVASRHPRLRSQLIAFSAVRTVLNTGYRMVYPFLPVLARGLGVDLETMALAITARSALGMAAPFLGGTADAHGRKTAMLLGLVLFSLGLGLVGLWPTFGVFTAGLLLAMAGKIIFDPAMQAYLGDRIHYARRGLAIALTELGWSASFFVGMPLVGWLIDRRGWLAPFPVLALLGVLAFVVLTRLLPPEEQPHEVRQSLRRSLKSVLRHRPALAGLCLGLLVSAANELVGIIFGAWMEGAFGLQVAALGAASAVIGLAELGGEGLVAGLVDRLGKRRAVALGIGLNAAASLTLPLLGRSLPGALVGLFLLYITFEFTLVSSIPLMTQILPGARATLMASNIAALSAGRAIGALLGPLLFSAGLLANGAVAALFNVLALGALWYVGRVE